jgi:arylsulfatase B
VKPKAFILAATLGLVLSLTAAGKPNIILIVTDDQGYADAGFRNPEVHTPNLDKLVASGVELKRFYTAPVCSPTRAGLMTGLYPIRFGMQRAVNRPFSEIGLPEPLTTLPEALGNAGYKERHIVGKWHLGNMRKSHLPLNHGFTHQYGPYTSGIDYFKHTRDGVHDFHRNQATIRQDGYYTDLLSNEAVRIIDGHKPADPFFIYLPYGAPHTPLQAPAREIERYQHLGIQRATFLAMITVIDHGLGRILDALDRKNIADRTLVVFLSDNGGGPGSDNQPLKGGKGTLHEGGIRVIAAASWPGRIPAGSVCETPTSYIDVMPTLLDAAGVSKGEMPDDLDGQSALAIWQGEANAGQRNDEFYSYYENRSKQPERLSIHKGNWKLIRQGPPILDGARVKGMQLTLHDLGKDPGETRNLAAEHPQLVESLLTKLVAFRKLRPEGGVPPMIEPPPEGWIPFPDWEPVAGDIDPQHPQLVDQRQRAGLGFVANSPAMTSPTPGGQDIWKAFEPSSEPLGQ